MKSLYLVSGSRLAGNSKMVFQFKVAYVGGKGAGNKTKGRLCKSLSDQRVWSGEYVLHMCLVIMEHQLTTISCVLDHFSMVLVTHG